MKRLRHTDRMSALPDETLQRILSHLPSVGAVQTSVLSRRWHDVYAGLPVVDLLDPKSDRDDYHKKKVCFDQQVTGAILCKAPGTLICVFRLDAFCPPCDLLDQWIIIAVSSGVEEMDVKLRYWESSSRHLCPAKKKASADFDSHDRKRYIKTQHHLFGCPTLRNLRLTRWTLDLPPVVVMSSLDTLCLTRIMDPKDHLQQLLSNCPLLADLTLQEFAMIYCQHATRVKLSSSCLRSLHYQGGLPSHKSLFKLANHAGVVALKVEICEDLSEKEPKEFAPATKLIKRCTKLAYLNLSFRPSMTYCSSLFIHEVPCLQHLRELGLHCCLRNDQDVRSVAVLLGDTQNLEVLSLLGPETPNYVVSSYLSDSETESESDIELEDGGDDGVDDSSQVTDNFWPMNIRCLDDKLRRINIRNYGGLQPEKILSKFLLSKAAALEEFSVSSTSRCSQNKRNIAKELRSWRSNRNARVTVHRW
ncbi:unnamed protein product [Alopecurus aequalis]